MKMMRKPTSFLMLFLVNACPVVCGASLSATQFCKGDSDQSSNAPNDPCCPGGDRGPSTPDEPCNNTTCFCSPFVMHETSNNPVLLLALPDCPALVLQDDLSRLFCFLPIRASWERPIFPPGMTQTAAALPLLI